MAVQENSPTHFTRSSSISRTFAPAHRVYADVCSHPGRSARDRAADAGQPYPLCMPCVELLFASPLSPQAHLSNTSECAALFFRPAQTVQGTVEKTACTVPVSHPEAKNHRQKAYFWPHASVAMVFPQIRAFRKRGKDPTRNFTRFFYPKTLGPIRRKPKICPLPTVRQFSSTRLFQPSFLSCYRFQKSRIGPP